MAGSTVSLSGDRSTYRFDFKGLSSVLPNAPNLHDPDKAMPDASAPSANATDGT